MKKALKTVLCIILLIAAFMSICISVSAHSGKTDGNGGHKDNKNISGLGNYHYHCGGYPAHLHPEGYCPYESIPVSQADDSKESNASSYCFNDTSYCTTKYYKDNHSDIIIIKENLVCVIFSVSVAGIISILYIQIKKKSHTDK